MLDYFFKKGKANFSINSSYVSFVFPLCDEMQTNVL